MKLKYFSLFIVFALVISFFSCKSESNKDDTTIKPTATDPRDKFIGAWTCDEYSKVSQTSNTYTIQIFKSSSSSSEIMISKFYDLTDTVYAHVSGSNLTIPYQTINIGFAAGTGTVNANGNQLQLYYTIQSGSGKDTCTSTCTKN